jgi:carbon monoxide dehydrogenase subunit G
VRIENTFTVAAPADAAWDLLMDVPRVIPCMPGATLDEVVDESHWKATMQVKLGPIALTFATDVERAEADESGKRVVLVANAREVKNRGRAQASVESQLVPEDGGTRVQLNTDLSLSGPAAQYGRGLIQDISTQLISSFATCLEAQLAASPEEAAAATAAQARPVGGLSLFFAALGRKISRLFGRRPE